MKKQSIILIAQFVSIISISQSFNGYELTNNLFRIEYCNSLQMDADEQLELVVVSNSDRKFTIFDYANGLYERTTVLYDFSHNIIGTEDFDNDGDQDFFATKTDYIQEITKFVWLENDSGIDLIEHIIESNFPASAVKFVDYDEDGYGDIVYDNSGMLYMRTGSSFFTEIVSTPFDFFSASIKTISDLNNDGYLDIAGYSSNIEFLFKGISYFEFEQVDFNVNLYESQVADLDGDSLPELINLYDGEIKVHKNNGNFEFEIWENPIDLQEQVSDFYISDFDFDGDLDLVISKYGDLLWVELDGLEFIATHVLIQDCPVNLIYQILDADLDGDKDLIGANYNYYQLYHVPLDNFVSFAVLPMHNGYWEAFAITSGEFNNEFGVEVLFKDELDYKLHYISHITDDVTTFEYEIYDIGLDWSSYPLLVNDWNNDGYMDIITTIGFDSIVSINGLATGEVQVEVIVDLPIPADFISGIADFDNNGHYDFLFTSNESTMIALNGGGNFDVIEVISNAYVCEIFDYDNDGWQDISYTSALGNGYSKTILWNNSGVFIEFTQVGNAQLYSPMVSHDVNQDGLMDIVYISSIGANLAFILNEGERNFQNSPILTPESIISTYINRIEFADLNGDSRDDVMVNGSGWLLYNQIEDFTYALADTMNWYFNYAPNIYNRVHVADVNGDQFDDLIVPSWHSSIIWCDINNGDFPSSVLDYEMAVNFINAYPNPCITPCQLNFTEPIINVEIYDSWGRMIFQSKITTQILDLSNLESGVYILSSSTITGEVVKSKLLVE